MRTDYGLRPNERSETESFPRRVHAEIEKMDEAEQSYFRANPSEIAKHPKVAKALFVDKVVLCVLDARMRGARWEEVRAAIRIEFGLDLSESTLRRWCSQQ